MDPILQAINTRLDAIERDQAEFRIREALKATEARFMERIQELETRLLAELTRGRGSRREKALLRRVRASHKKVEAMRPRIEAMRPRINELLKGTAALQRKAKAREAKLARTRRVTTTH